MVCGLLLLVGAASADPADYREGDLIYIKIPTSFGRAIEEVTHSPVSHVGIVARHESGALTVVHALGKVQEEPLDRFLHRSKGFWAVQRYAFESPAALARFVASARSFLGRKYDYFFVIDNEDIYCSELVYRAFRDGLNLVPVPLKGLTFGAPGSEARRVMERITQGPVPEGTAGIEPGQYFASPRFRMIEDHLAGFSDGETAP